MTQSKNSQYAKMSETPVPKLILELSVPAIISMLVTNIYNLVDTAFVGRLGTSASGAVGIVFGFMAIIQAFGFMFGQGSGSILSRALGKRDIESASVHATAGFFGSFLFGLLICIFGFALLDDVVYLLGSTDTIAPYAKAYISYILISAPFMCSCLTMNNILRYEGKAFLGMIGLMSGAILNMVGDPILMFGLKMGISGAGLSTALSQLVSWCILLWMFLSGKTESKLSLANARLVTLAMIGNIMATGFPSLLRQALNSITTVMLNSRCGDYGDAAVAAMSIVSRIAFFAFSVALGVGQGFQPVSAFSYGARKYTRLRKGFRFACLMSEGIIIVSCAVLIVFSGDLIGIFRDDEEVIRIGTRALRLQALATLVLPPCMVVEMLFQSTGKRLGASILSSLRNGLFFIAALMILPRIRGLAGIQESQPLSMLVSVPLFVVFAVFFFRRLPKEQVEQASDT
ncbi:MATE family efflux transporter [Ruminococcus flavefaciens]|uniref:MATE family efflux transporter n=1 Tax=Ruminococcus flavefaciens TaxID=1265 RepID=UPI0026F12BC4|nr:MATE family efflux transporter [Ruminococcus flavefaciens]